MLHTKRLSAGSIALTALLLAGCGSDSSTPLLQGNAAFRAAAIASNQALKGGINYPFAILQNSFPTNGRAAKGADAGSPTAELIRTLLKTSSRKATAQNVPTRVGGLTYNAILNLYSTPLQMSGNSAAINYYTDAAGTQAAGALTITQTSTSSYSTAYSAYPATITAKMELTAGNLPCSGTMNIVYSDANGANSMTGKLTLTRTSVDVNINMTLTSNLKVGGSISMQESGATISLTNIAGDLASPLTCDVSVAPYGWTGSGTFSLLDGTFSMNMNTTTGRATAAPDSSGNLAISYADGAKETVTSPLLAALVGGSGGSGGNNGGSTGGTTGGSYTVKTLTAALPQAITADGILIATDTNASSPKPIYLASPDAPPVALQPYNGLYPYSLHINKTGQVVGFNSDVKQPIFYANSSVAPILLTQTHGSSAGAFGINDSGAMIGYQFISAGYTTPAYWSSGYASPTDLTLPDGDVTGSSRAITSDGQIIGSASPLNGSTNHLLYWANPTAKPQILQDISGGQNTTLNSINKAGQIVGTSQIGSTVTPVFWSSPTTAPQTLPVLSGTSGVEVLAMNASGLIVGSSQVSGKQVAVLWKDGKVQNLNDLLPSGSNLVLSRATGINDSGTIVGTASQTTSSGTQTVGFVLTPK